MAQSVQAVEPPPPGSTNTTTLGKWSFNDTNNWTSDKGYAPIAFTNLTSSILGNGTALVVDSTNAAFLQYNVIEQDGTTNLTVDNGSVMFWFAPNWCGTNAGGTGPGVWGRLIEVGSYTPDASYGWWSLYLDDAGCNLYFSAQGNDGTGTTYLTAPITWDITNRWHHVALTYTATNTALYVDGVLATNGAPMTCWPGPEVLTNGFCIGSDTNGLLQAHGMYDDFSTYSGPLDGETITSTFLYDSLYYYGNPLNAANMAHAPYPPSSGPTLNAITGPGFLQLVGSTTNCETGFDVWLTNLVCIPNPLNPTNWTANATFTIGGGIDNVPYDVFANAILGPTTSTNYQWVWMGEGYHCNAYMLTNLPAVSAFLILGTPQDSDADGLTDAFEKLVTHTNPNVPDTSGDGISDLFKLLHGMALTNVVAVPSLSSVSIPTCPIQ